MAIYKTDDISDLNIQRLEFLEMFRVDKLSDKMLEVINKATEAMLKK